MENTIKPVKVRNVHTKVFARVCEDLKIPYRVVFDTHALWVSTKSGKEELMYKAISPLNATAYSKLSKNKRETIFTLKKAGIPVPEQIRIKTFEDIELFYKIHPKLVIKPIDSSGGKGVIVLPKENELQDAYNRALIVSKKIIAEEFIPGMNYRFLVLDDKVLAVALRLPPFIIGDGKSSVRTLIEDYNLENKRRGIPIVKLNSYTWQVVENQGFRPDGILPVGKQLYTRLTANLSQGGSIKDVTATIDESYKVLAISAAKTVHLRLAGIDVISTDLTKPGNDCRVIETNAAPGMRIHYKDESGAKLDVAKDIVKAVAKL
jgi:cyanophycin synthetase